MLRLKSRGETVLCGHLRRAVPGQAAADSIYCTAPETDKSDQLHVWVQRQSDVDWEPPSTGCLMWSTELSRVIWIINVHARRHCLKSATATRIKHDVGSATSVTHLWWRLGRSDG